MNGDSTQPKRSDPIAWVIWVMGAFCFFFAFFQRVTPSIIVEELMRDFAVTAGIVGTLSALYFYFYAAVQIPVGLLVDRWGPRRLLATAIALNGVGTLLFAGTGDLSVAYLGRILIGLGSAVGWVGSLKLIAAWFPPERFAFLTGCTSAIGMAGAMTGQAPMAALIGVAGWRPTLVGVGFFALIYAAALWLIVRDAPPGAPRPAAEGIGDVLRGLRRVVGRWQTWNASLLSAGLTAPQASFGALWGVPFLMEAHGIERTTAAASTSMLLFGWAIGGPLAGWLSDRIQLRRPPLMVGAVIALGALAAVIYVPNLPLIAAQGLLLLNGIAAGAMILCFVVAREHNDPQASGAAIGVVNMTTMAAGALAQTAIGWLLDLAWGGGMHGLVRAYTVGEYRIAFAVIVLCGVAAITLSLTLRETRARQAVETESES